MRTEFAKRTARKLRQSPTEAEKKLWAVLRSQQLQSYKFRRQHAVGAYIADFACLSRRLIVEADGGQHAGCGQDEIRTAALNQAGWQVIRFWNPDILTNIEGVQIMILEALLAQPETSRYTLPDIEIVND